MPYFNTGKRYGINIYVLNYNTPPWDTIDKYVEESIESGKRSVSASMDWQEFIDAILTQVHGWVKDYESDNPFELIPK